MIDITMPATGRADIVKRTLASFRKNLFRNSFAQLILNIDPAGPDPQLLVYKTALDFFDVYAFRAPWEASFPKAFKWAWSRANTEYVFHLEDDWLLTRPVDIHRLMAILDVPGIASVRLPAFAAGVETMKNWNKIFKRTGPFYYEPPEGEEWLGFCGHPSLIKGEFVRKCASLIDETLNPEKQFHKGNPALNEEFRKWRYVVYGEPSDPPSPPLVVDLGRDWMIKNGLKKAGNKAFFTQWEQANNA